MRLSSELYWLMVEYLLNVRRKGVFDRTQGLLDRIH